MKEPLTNVGFVCEHLAPAAGKYAGQDAKQFVGKFIKMAFDAVNPQTNRPTKEHMWVLVENEKDGTLTGKLDNDPILQTSVQCGDTIHLTVDQIEDVVE
jgi:uncharacterized protein YegJ (DUF2314 family)